MKNKGFKMEHEVVHECAICKYRRKCLRFLTIMQTLAQLEAQVFEKYDMNLEARFIIDDCKKFMPDFDLMAQLFNFEEGEEDG